MRLIDYIPKGKREAVGDIYKDEDGYWVRLRTGFKLVGYFTETTIREDTISGLRDAAKLITKEEKQ